RVDRSPHDSGSCCLSRTLCAHRSPPGDSHDGPHRPLRVPASYVLALRSSERENVSRVWQRSITFRTNHNLVTVRTRTRTNSRLVNRHETPSRIEGTVPKATILNDLKKTVMAEFVAQRCAGE